MKKTLFLLFILAVSIVTSAVFAGVVGGLLFSDGEFSSSFLMFMNYIATFGLAILILFVFRRAFSWRLPTFVPELRRINFTKVIAALVGIFALGILAEPLLRYVPEVGLSDLYDRMQGGIWAVVTVVFAAPILEEYLFRGVVQRNAVRFLGNPYFGILVASVAFALAHTVPQQMVMAFFSSLIIGAVYYTTNSLVTVVILHLLNNGLAYTLYLYLGVAGSILEPFAVGGTAYWVIYSLCGVYVVFGGWLLVVQINERVGQNSVSCGPANPLE